MGASPCAGRWYRPKCHFYWCPLRARSTWRTASRTIGLALLSALGVAGSARGQADAKSPNDPAIAGDGQSVLAVHVGAPGPLRPDLTNPVWTTADSLTVLRQLDPVEGAPATERTGVKVLRGADALLIGLRAYDRDPAG